MKRFLSLLLAAVLLLALAACGGNVKDVQTKAVASEMYTQNDIDAAIDVIKKDFSRDWKGCTLTEISYAGDDVSREHQDWADRNNADGRRSSSRPPLMWTNPAPAPRSTRGRPTRAGCGSLSARTAARGSTSITGIKARK